MLDMILQFAEQLTLPDKKSLLSSLKSMVASELVPEPGEPDACPRCGCGAFVRRGKCADGSQRWVCRGCARSFTAKTRSVLAASRLEEWQWMAFAECMADLVTLRESAERCAVSLPTAWFMRMRVCQAMSRRLPAFRPEGRVQVDETFVSESFKGDHRRSRAFSMPRAARKSGKVRGTSKASKICVLTGINESGDVFAEPIGRDMPNRSLLEGALRGRVDGTSRVETDGLTTYRSPLRDIGVASHRAFPVKAGASRGALGMVNGMHSRLEGFLDGFHGVSTRRLPLYLAWFCFREMVRAPGEDRREVLFRHEAEGLYELTRRDLFSVAHPFMDYWAVSTVV